MKYQSLILCILLLGLFVGPVAAESYERVPLKNGSYYEGYIKTQYPGEKFIVTADEAHITVSTDSVSFTMEDVKLNRLSKAWKKWADENPDVIKVINGDKYIRMAQLKYKKSNNKKSETNKPVRIERRSDKEITFFDMDRTETILYKDVLMIEKSRRNASDLSGLIEEVIIEGDAQSVRGQILTKVIGDKGKFSILTDEDYIHDVPVDRIAAIKISALNPDQNILEQTRYLDCVTTDVDDKYTGVITGQYFSVGKQEAHITMVTEDNEIQDIPSDYVSMISKIPNKNYKPLTDVRIDSSHIVMVCGNKLKPMEIDYNKDMQTYFFDKKAEPIVILKDSIESLKLEVLETPSNDMIFVFEPTFDSDKRNGKKNSNTERVFTFTYEDIVNKSLLPTSRIVTANKTLRRSYEVTSGKNYVIYCSRDKRAYLIKIK